MAAKKSKKKSKKKRKLVKRPDQSRARAKRGSTLRKGFEYQDLVAAESLLKMLLDPDGPLAVSLENRCGGTFDDVVEHFPDRVVWKQVKWSANPMSAPLTLEALSATGRRRTTSLISSFASSWKRLTEEGRAFQIQLVSCRDPDSELRGMIEGDPPRLQDNLSGTKQQRLENAWLAETGLTSQEFENFLGAIEFHLSKPSREDQIREVKRLLMLAQAPEDSFLRLLEAIRIWSTDPTTLLIHRPDIDATLGLFGETPDNRFRIDRKLLVSRSSLHTLLASLVRASAGSFVLVLGSPGSGKSCALNTIGPHSSLSRDNAIVLYNCFTGPGDSHARTRASAANFVSFLVREMHRIAPGKWKRRSGAPDEIEAVISEASGVMPKNKRLLIIIDGIDYAEKNKSAAGNALFDALPVTIPQNVTLVLSAQTKEQLPGHLQALDDKQYFPMPQLTREETKALVAKTGVFSAWSISTVYDEGTITRAVIEKTGGHPLITQYVAKWLASNPGRVASVNAMLDRLPEIGQDIRSWYAQLPGIQDAYARALLAEIAACPFPLTAAEADSLVAHPRDPYHAENALQELAFLLQHTGAHWCFRHDSLRAYIRERVGGGTGTPDKHFDLLCNLSEDARFGNHALGLAVSCCQQDWAFDAVDAQWISERLSEGSRPSSIVEGLGALLEHAIKLHEWAQAAKWALYLQRLVFELDVHLDWESIDEVWLRCGHRERVLQRIIDGEEVLLYPADALRAAEMLKRYEYLPEADQVERLSLSAPLEYSEHARYKEWKRHAVPFVEALARNVSVVDCVAENKRIAERATTMMIFWNDVEARDVAGQLNAVAAFACLWDRQWDKVREWCARKYVGPLAKLSLRAGAALASNEKLLPKATIVASLKADPQLWLIRAASQHKQFLKAAQTALKDRALPPTELVEPPSSLDREEVEAAVRHVFDEVRLALKLRLGARIEALRSAIPAPPLRKAPLLYAASVRVALALPTPDSANTWDVAATELLRCIEDSGFGRLPRRDRWEQYGVRGAFLFLLHRIARVAHQGRALNKFAIWVHEALGPTLADDGFVYDDVIKPVLMAVLHLIADDSTRAEVLDAWESEADAAWTHKAAMYLQLAECAGRCGDLARAEHLLRNTFKSSLTYGYRKDETILVLTDALALLGRDLGQGLPDYVAQAAATIEILTELTDGKFLHDSGVDLVAVVALTDPRMAAQLANPLFARLEGQFVRSPLSAALRQRGVEFADVENQFDAEGVLLDASDYSAATAVPSSESMASLAELLREYGESSSDLSGGERRREVENSILGLVVDRETFDIVTRVFADERSISWYPRLRLAERAAEISLLDEASRLVGEISLEALGDEYWYWSSEHMQLIRSAARINPGAALQILESAAERTAVQGPAYMGIHFVDAIVHTLFGAGRIDEAKNVFAVLATFLADLMSSYPSKQPEWRSYLS